MDCTICTENLCRGHGGAVALQCGHVLHSVCALSLFNRTGRERPGECPVCRKISLKTELIRLFIQEVPQYEQREPAPQRAPIPRYYSAIPRYYSPHVERFRQGVQDNQTYFALRKELMALQKEIARQKHRNRRK